MKESCYNKCWGNEYLIPIYFHETEKEAVKMQKKKASIILASASPRRRELLGMICHDFSVIVSECEEIVSSTVPEEVTIELSKQKAQAVAKGRADAVVIGADTVVSIDGEILGKPKDREDACRMLRMLSGRTHQVSTGVTILQTGADADVKGESRFAETTLVHVAPLSESELASYLDTDEPYDKAGAYGIQGMFGKFITGIEGDYNNVVGLPVHRLYEEWKKMS